MDDSESLLDSPLYGYVKSHLCFLMRLEKFALCICSELWRSRYVLQVPVLMPMDLMVEASPRRIFANAHTYHINSISVNSDHETYLSADDLRINLWHLEITDRSFSILFLVGKLILNCAAYLPVVYATSKFKLPTSLTHCFQIL